MSDINIGLEGVVVGETAISNVLGEEGILSYRDRDITELVEEPFLHVAWLLLFGERPSLEQTAQLAGFLAAHRDLTRHETALLEALPRATHPMLMLQSLVPVLDLSRHADIELPIATDDAVSGLIIAAKIPTLIASWYHCQRGEPWPLPASSPEPQRAFLEALRGIAPSEAEVAALDRTQILQMEHSYNAGTFAGRVTLSTQAPIQSSISASIGTLFGALHGGADQAALEFAERVGSADAAPAAVRTLLESGGRVMGMGHREYQTVDPRATLLKPMARALCRTRPDSARLLETLEAIEAACIAQREAASPGAKPLRANVEFYKGAVFHALGIPSHFFTAMFAMARVYGYIAHALEFRPHSRLIRPRALYRGARRAGEYAA
jgi:citrate synthase